MLWLVPLKKQKWILMFYIKAKEIEINIYVG